jgi:ribosomal protein S19E (S16A)
VPQHAEKSLSAVTAGDKSDFIRVLEKRLEEMTASQATRVKKIIKTAEKREWKPD